MKYQINSLKVSPYDLNRLKQLIAQKYHLNSFNYKILAKSIDARNKDKIVVLFKLLIETDDIIKHKDFTPYVEKSIDIDYPKWHDISPVIVGFGPAGMLAGLYLARCGAKPIIIERGSKIEQRKKDVQAFIDNKQLNEASNIQFGEGGAGAFSDGKLNTNVKNPLINFILNEFYIHGAKEDILYDAKPHIGTDYLELVVKNIRLEIEKLGGSFYFNHKFLDAKKVGDILNLVIEGESLNELKTKHLLLALGHSARDTIRHLYNNMGLIMEPKSFSMGVRIEHPRELINRLQYGKFSRYLPAAYYSLACHIKPDNRGVYTFCMCPGGYVMASQSEENSICVNGMSFSNRDGENSNSAILVDVNPSDYLTSNNSVLDGISYQEKYERLAFNLSLDYKAPANLVKEFLNEEIAKEERSVKTSYPHGLYMCDLKKCLPEYVIDGIKYGIKEFDKRVKGFNYDDAIIIGIESRSSSPVRIIRDENKEASIKGIYPIGEGAGYAGGITSAALDGLKVAMEIVQKCRK